LASLLKAFLVVGGQARLANLERHPENNGRLVNVVQQHGVQWVVSFADDPKATPTLFGIDGENLAPAQDLLATESIYNLRAKLRHTAIRQLGMALARLTMSATTQCVSTWQRYVGDDALRADLVDAHVLQVSRLKTKESSGNSEARLAEIDQEWQRLEVAKHALEEERKALEQRRLPLAVAQRRIVDLPPSPMRDQYEGRLVEIKWIHENGEHWVFALCEDDDPEPALFGLPPQYFHEVQGREEADDLALKLHDRLQRSATRRFANAVTSIVKNELGIRVEVWKKATQVQILRRDMAEAINTLTADHLEEFVAEPQPGTQMRLCQLQQTTELNGTLVNVVEPAEEAGVWYVSRCDDGSRDPESFLVHRNNLTGVGHLHIDEELAFRLSEKMRSASMGQLASVMRRLAQGEVGVAVTAWRDATNMFRLRSETLRHIEKKVVAVETRLANEPKVGTQMRLRLQQGADTVPGGLVNILENLGASRWLVSPCVDSSTRFSLASERLLPVGELRVDEELHLKFAGKIKAAAANQLGLSLRRLQGRGIGFRLEVWRQRTAKCMVESQVKQVIEAQALPLQEQLGKALQAAALQQLRSALRRLAKGNLALRLEAWLIVARSAEIGAKQLSRMKQAASWQLRAAFVRAAKGVSAVALGVWKEKVQRSLLRTDWEGATTRFRAQVWSEVLGVNPGQLRTAAVAQIQFIMMRLLKGEVTMRVAVWRSRAKAEAMSYVQDHILGFVQGRRSESQHAALIQMKLAFQRLLRGEVAMRFQLWSKQAGDDAIKHTVKEALRAQQRMIQTTLKTAALKHIKMALLRLAKGDKAERFEIWRRRANQENLTNQVTSYMVNNASQAEGLRDEMIAFVQARQDVVREAALAQMKHFLQRMVKGETALRFELWRKAANQDQLRSDVLRVVRSQQQSANVVRRSASLRQLRMAMRRMMKGALAVQFEQWRKNANEALIIDQVQRFASRLKSNTQVAAVRQMQLAVQSIIKGDVWLRFTIWRDAANRGILEQQVLSVLQHQEVKLISEHTQKEADTRDSLTAQVLDFSITQRRKMNAAALAHIKHILHKICRGDLSMRVVMWRDAANQSLLESKVRTAMADQKAQLTSQLTTSFQAQGLEWTSLEAQNENLKSVVRKLSASYEAIQKRFKESEAARVIAEASNAENAALLAAAEESLKLTDEQLKSAKGDLAFSKQGWVRAEALRESAASVNDEIVKDSEEAQSKVEEAEAVAAMKKTQAEVERERAEEFRQKAETSVLEKLEAKTAELDMKLASLEMVEALARLRKEHPDPGSSNPLSSVGVRPALEFASLDLNQDGVVDRNEWERATRSASPVAGSMPATPVMAAAGPVTPGSVPLVPDALLDLETKHHSLESKTILLETKVASLEASLSPEVSYTSMLEAHISDLEAELAGSAGGVPLPVVQEVPPRNRMPTGASSQRPSRFERLAEEMEAASRNSRRSSQNSTPRQQPSARLEKLANLSHGVFGKDGGTHPKFWSKTGAVSAIVIPTGSAAKVEKGDPVDRDFEKYGKSDDKQDPHKKYDQNGGRTPLFYSLATAKAHAAKIKEGGRRRSGSHSSTPRSACARAEANVGGRPHFAQHLP